MSRKRSMYHRRSFYRMVFYNYICNLPRVDPLVGLPGLGDATAMMRGFCYLGNGGTS